MELFDFGIPALDKALNLTATVLLLLALGMLLIQPPKDITQGQADCEQVRVSGKLPGRVVRFYVKEGDYVHKGDTLVSISSKTVDAALYKAQSAQRVAASTAQKVEKGTREEIKSGANSMVEQAKAAQEIAHKTYQRIENLYKEGVMTEQKRDEAKAQYDAAVATEKAAKAKYDMAVNGARKEEKSMAQAQANRAKGAIAEVHSYIKETVLTATADGLVTEIFPEVGELVGTGAPIMNVSVVKDVWFVFNIREDKLKGYSVGTEAEVYVPAVDKTIPVRITLMKDVGSFAVWKATKALDDLDLKTFEVQAHPLQPVSNIMSGMSAVLRKSSSATDKSSKN